MNKIKILLADDHLVVRSGIRNLLEEEQNLLIIGEASNGEEALKLARELNPDVVIMDIRMPVMNGLEATRKMVNETPDVKTLILSMHDDEDYILQAAENGAWGYLLKDTNKETFLKAIQTIYEGGKYFSGDISKVLVNQYLSLKNPQPTNKSAVASNFDLTKREVQILSMIMQGTGNKEIAEQLGKSIRTIETHRFNIMKKLKVNNVVELLKKVEEEPGLKTMVETQG